jgi:hypothetical protein
MLKTSFDAPREEDRRHRWIDLARDLNPIAKPGTGAKVNAFSAPQHSETVKERDSGV